MTKKVRIIKTPMLLMALSVSSFTFAIPDAPDVKASAYALMEYSTGKILKEENADKKLPPASLTKVMTAYVVFEEIKSGRLKLDDKVKISKKSWSTQGSKTFVKVGDLVPVSDLIKGMLVQSGNDASIALAEHIAGSESDFADLMNYQAKKIGMKNSNFKNATGLHMRGHYTTAHDLALLTRQLIKEFPEYYYIFQIKQFTYAQISQRNRNKLLNENLGFDGLKTGYTSQAGYCYIGSSKRDDTRMIVTLLDEPSPKQRFEDAKTLVNYAFRFFEPHVIFSNDKMIPELTTHVYKGNVDELFVSPKETINTVLERGKADNIKYKVNMIDYAIAPIDKGEKVGVITATINGKEIAKSDLIAINKIDEGGLLKRTNDSIKLILKEGM